MLSEGKANGEDRVVICGVKFCGGDLVAAEGEADAAR
jgi:hypothetical protein